MIGTRPSYVAYVISTLLAFCALAVSVVFGIVGVPWFLAALIDGRWQGGFALATWLAMAIAQVWLIFSAQKHLGQSKELLAVGFLLIATVPAFIFVYVVIQ